MTDLAVRDIGDRMMKEIAFVMAVKADMVQKLLIWDERAGCPRCGGIVKIALVGLKQHVRATCQTPNCLSVME